MQWKGTECDGKKSRERSRARTREREKQRAMASTGLCRLTTTNPRAFWLTNAGVSPGIMSGIVMVSHEYRIDINREMQVLAGAGALSAP